MGKLEHNVTYLHPKKKKMNSTGPGSVDLAKKKPKNDIDICKVLMLVHLFPKYFEIIFLRSVCGSV